MAAAALKSKNLVWLAVLGLIAAGFALAFLKGCDETTSRSVQPVKIDGKTFFLEIAADDATRMKGLGGRTEIPEDGGMLFVFSRPIDPAYSAGGGGFVMRDCPVDIDIIFLDPNGRIVTMHQMKAEPPRGTFPNEGEPGTYDPDNPYERRLKKYPSRFPYQFAVELKGGTIPTLNIKEGDKINLPVDKLKVLAR